LTISMAAALCLIGCAGASGTANAAQAFPRPQRRLNGIPAPSVPALLVS
jgi:hypothetical protein